MQGIIEVLATWLNNWRMLASLTKTKAMILDKKTTIIEAQTSLIFEGHQIKNHRCSEGTWSHHR